LSGSIPLPVEEVEELGAHEIVAHEEEESPLAALMDEPATAMNNGRVAELERKVEELQSSLEEILRTLGDLTTRVRSQLNR
jgi:hypothetical protein